MIFFIGALVVFVLGIIVGALWYEASLNRSWRKTK